MEDTAMAAGQKQGGPSLSRLTLARLWVSHPRCGATTRGTGLPCQRLAGPNGRCRFHGGRVPKGKNWHRLNLVPPPPDASPAQQARYARKLAGIARRAERREARLAAMTPEERAQFEARSQAVTPGSKADREHRRQNREARALLERLMRADRANEAGPEPAGSDDTSDPKAR